MRLALASIALVLLGTLLIACSSSATPTSTPLPPPKTATRPALGLSSSSSSVNNASPAIATALPTDRPSTASSAMPDFPTTTPPLPTPVIPSGLYVTALQSIPELPTRGTDLIFYSTFANNTNSLITFRWLVRIFKPDNLTKSFGQTTSTLFTDLGPGVRNQTLLGNWKLPLGGPCENFIARIYFIDQNNQETPFKQPNGQVFEKPMSVCPPLDLPTAIPGIATPAPINAPGLFVTNLRTDPTVPRRGSDIYFYPSFNNTTGTVQNYRWRILIYRSDSPNRSYSDTAVLQSAIALGNTEQRSEAWRIALGGPCEDFVIRVVWLDQNNGMTPFTSTEGKVFDKLVTICPP